MQTSGYKVKNRLILGLFVVFVLLLTTQNIFAQTDYYSQGTGNFGTTSNWNTIRGGTGSSPSSITTDNFIIQPGHTITNDGTYTINSLTIEDDATTGGAYVHNSNTLTLEGNLTVITALANPGDWGTGGDAVFTTATSNTVQLDSDDSFGDLTVNKSSGDLTANSDIDIDGNFVITAGTYDGNNNTTTVGGSFTQNGTLEDGFKGAPSFVFHGNGTLSGSGAIEFDDVTYSGSGATYTISTNFAAASFALSAGTFNAGSNVITIFEAGGAEFSRSSGTTFNAGTSKFIFTTTSTGTQTISSTGSLSFYDLEHSPSLSRSLTFSGTGPFLVTHSFNRVGQSSTVTGATLNLTGATLVYNGSVAMNISNEWPTTTDGNEPTTINITTSSTVTNASGAREVNNLIVNASGATLDIDGGSITVNSQLTKTNGSITETTAEAFGWGSGTTTLLYNGAAQQSVGVEWDADGTVPDNVRVNNSTSTNPALVLGSSTLPALSGNLTLSDGSVDYTAGSQDLIVDGNVIGGSGSFGTVTDDAELVVRGGSSAVTSSGATTLHDLTFNSTVTTNGSLNNVTIEGALVLSTSSIVTLTGNVTSAPTVTLNGSLNLGGFTISGTPAFTLAGTGILNTNGTDISSYTINSNAGTIIFNGTSSEVIPNFTFWNLEIDNSNGADVSTNSPTVNNTLTLTDGILTTTSSLITAASVTTGGTFGPSLHVNGPLALSGGGNQTFPIGKNGIYRPVRVTNTTGTTQFELFNNNPEGTAGLPPAVISSVRYWQGSGTINSTTSTVELAYGGDDGVSVPADLVVASSATSGGTYVNEGQSALNTTFSSSVVSAANLGLTSLRYFTLGSTTTDNSLPVSLTSFTANAEFSQITLNWQTESEIDNQGFNIYRATGANPDNWESLNQELIPGAGNTSAKTEYVFVDQSVQSGETYYYQLESISYNGVRELFVESTVTVVAPVPTEFALLNNYPNPFNPVTNIKFQVPDQSEVTIIVYDVQGNLVKKLLSKSIYSAGEHVTQWDATDQLGTKVSSGIYFYQFVSGNYQKFGKMMLIK